MLAALTTCGCGSRLSIAIALMLSLAFALMLSLAFALMLSLALSWLSDS